MLTIFKIESQFFLQLFHFEIIMAKHLAANATSSVAIPIIMN